MNVLVCMPADQPLVAEGSVFQCCHTCGLKVVIAPSGQELLKRDPTVQIVCVHCCARNVEAEHEIKLCDSVERITKEMQTAVPNLRRTRN